MIDVHIRNERHTLNDPCSLELTWCCYLHRSQSPHISDWSGEADIWKNWLWSVCKLLHNVHPCFNGTLEHLCLSILCKCQWMTWVPGEWPLMQFPVAIIQYVSQKCFPPTLVHTDTETGIRDKHVQAFTTNGYRHPRLTDMGCQDKQGRASKTNGNRCPTDLEWASDKTGTDRTTAIGSCRECWRILANDTYVQVKSVESAYKGVKLS